MLENIVSSSRLIRAMQAFCLWISLGSAAAAQHDPGCELFLKAARIGASGETDGDPVVFGKPYAVPSLSFQFERDGKPLRPLEVHLFYFWNWLEYPYAEHPFGAWSDAADWFKCSVGEDGRLDVAPYTVRPSGWYQGFYNYFPWPKTPHFELVEVTVKVEGCAPKFQIRPQDLKRHEGVRATVIVSCEVPVKIVFPE